MNRMLVKFMGVVGVAGLTLALSAGAGVASTQLSDNAASSSSANASATGQHANQDQQSNNTSGSGGGLFSTGGGGNIAPQSQNAGQVASTDQFAASVASANLHALNANVPVTINGFGVVSGVDSGGANQVASNSADSHASNASSTNQSADQNQASNNSSGSGGGALFSTGGGGNIAPQSQNLNQAAATTQNAASAALANQKLVNANVPVTINGFGAIDPVSGFGRSANQVGLNEANSSAHNTSVTSQGADQNQAADNSSGAGLGGLFGTGGGGSVTPQHQGLGQTAATIQALVSLGQAAQALSNNAAPVAIG